MNINLIAADIAARVPEMARDSRVNNETLILNILTEAKREAYKDDIKELKEFWQTMKKDVDRVPGP